jgi:hypothetical protein
MLAQMLNVLITAYYGGDVGLAITQAIGLTGLIQKGIRQSAELENQMTAVERVLEYSEVGKEPSLESYAGEASKMLKFELQKNKFAVLLNSLNSLCSFLRKHVIIDFANIKISK